MGCSPFSQTDTLFFWGAMIFFMLTTFWFFALWAERPQQMNQYWQKSTRTLFASGDIIKFLVDGEVHEARICHFNHNIFGRVSAQIVDYNMPVESALRIRRCSPSQLTMKSPHWGKYHAA